MRLGELLAACLPSLCHACGEPVERWGGLRFATLCARCDDALLRGDATLALEPGLTLLAPFAPGPTVQALVKGLKYGGRDGALPLLADALAARLRRAAPPRPWWLQPVPLPLPRRLRRGFNQSALLAAAVASRCGAADPLALLRRRALSGRQAGRGREERLARAAGEYFARGAPPAEGTLILVDDLCTTGATLRACRAAVDPPLERHVLALVLARIPPPGSPLTG